ncbi:hypothetical protein LCGC14_2047940 [marine sediment metagenome]|uniref:Uncharacterized protein n=1 Tax=marine sediment metagenome TaxID=412755 RepID=A0A0F9EPS8_9ZZZZ
MMRAEKPPRAVIEERAREGYRRKFPEGRPSGAPAANGRPALRLLGADQLQIPYRGRVYDLGHVSFEDGIRLVEARAAIVAIGDGDDPTPENISAYGRAMRVVVSMAPRYMVPVGRIRRLFWRLRLRRNPFRKATESEVGHLLGFFLTCRMRSRVQYPTPTITAQEYARIS